MRTALSDILSFLVGDIFPVDATKLGKAPGSLLLHRIHAGEISVIALGEQGIAQPAREWNGSSWITKI